MNINTKFNPGDTVWYIQSRYITRKVNCVVCSNTGKITISCKEYTCPECRGLCQNEQYAGHKWISVANGIVGKITAEVVFDKYIDEDHPLLEIKYMLSTTGVHSGSFHSENDLFVSKEESIKECESRNANTKFEDDTF